MKNDIQLILQRGGAMKKFFYLLICLTLAACGSGKTASISSDTSQGTAGTEDHRPVRPRPDGEGEICAG